MAVASATGSSAGHVSSGDLNETLAVDRPNGSGAIELGLLVLLGMPAIAGLANFKNFYVAGVNHLVFFNYLAPLATLLALLVVAGLAPKRVRTWPGHRPWLVWYALAWLSAAWSDSFGKDAVTYAIDLSFPYLFGVAGATFVRNPRHLKWVLWSYAGGMATAGVTLLAWRLGIVRGGEFETGPALDLRPHSMSLLVAAAVCIAAFPHRKALPILGWMACGLMAAIAGSRGVAACMLVLPMFNPQIRGLSWRLLMVVLVIVAAVIILSIPQMQERFFPGGGGSISDLGDTEISGEGRFRAWPLILEQALERPLLGHGADSASLFVPRVWDRMSSPHNEFLRIGFEFGVVGIAVFFGALLWQMLQLWRTRAGAVAVEQIAFAAAMLGLLAFLMMSLTDNPLSNNLRFLNLVFLLAGAGFGSLLHRQGSHT